MQMVDQGTILTNVRLDLQQGQTLPNNNFFLLLPNEMDLPTLPLRSGHIGGPNIQQSSKNRLQMKLSSTCFSNSTHRPKQDHVVTKIPTFKPFHLQVHDFADFAKQQNIVERLYCKNVIIYQHLYNNSGDASF